MLGVVNRSIHFTQIQEKKVGMCYTGFTKLTSYEQKTNKQCIIYLLFKII